MRIIRLKEFYRTSAILLLNTLVLVFFLNVLLGITYFVKDQITSKKDIVVPKITDKPESDRLFDHDGAPLNNGQRLRGILEWFDYTAYEQIVDEAYAGNVLDDFF